MHQRHSGHQAFVAWCELSCRIHLFSTSEILPPHVRSQSTSICFVVLIVRSRSALLRAISFFFFITLWMYMNVHFPLSYCYRRVIDVQRVTCVTNDIIKTRSVILQLYLIKIRGKSATSAGILIADCERTRIGVCGFEACAHSSAAAFRICSKPTN